MKSLGNSDKACGNGDPATRLASNRLFPLLVLTVALAIARAASAQVLPEADAGGFAVTVGATASAYALQYGDRKMLGIAAIADIDSRRRIGIEGESQWLMFHQTAQVHTTTYLIGPRYHLTLGRFQPYAKFLLGLGAFSYPYQLGTDHDLVIAPGGGVDFRISRNLQLRIANFEYQYWPSFHYGALSSYGVSTGIRVRVF